MHRPPCVDNGELPLRPCAKRIAPPTAPGGVRRFYRHRPMATILLAEDSYYFRAAVALDLRMPKFDGVDVLAAIRSDPHLRNIPVLMMTAATTPLLEFHLRPSVQAWLVKASVGLSQLLDCIRTHSRGATFQPIQAPPTPP